jgi:hypothetical protein
VILKFYWDTSIPEIHKAFGFKISRIDTQRYSIEDIRGAAPFGAESYKEILPRSNYKITIFCPAGESVNHVKANFGMALRCALGLSDRIAAVRTPDKDVEHGEWWSLWEQGGNRKTISGWYIVIGVV